MLSDFDTQITCEEFYGEELCLADLNGPDNDKVLVDDDEDMLDTQEMDALVDDDDEDDHVCVVGADEPLYNDQGLTAAGYDLLAEMDRQGQFV